jgi:hypothetical protein
MRSYTINIIPEHTADPTVRISQYDKHYPIYFTIMDGDTEKDLTGLTALFSMTKPDGTKAYEECAIADGKVVLFVTPQMSAAAGNGTANITIKQGTRIESTSAFDFIIDPAAAPEEFWSEYEMAYYETMISRLETAMLATAEAQEYAEAASSSATAAATSAEQARVIAMADAIACFPIGTVLVTTNSTNPGTYIGGTWTAIEGKFLLAQSEDHTAGETGGAETVTLTVDELPSHRHGMDNYLIDDGTEQKTGWNGFTMRGKEVAIAELVKTRAVGGDMPHENMPPYLVVYMWERTA